MTFKIYQTLIDFNIQNHHTRYDQLSDDIKRQGFINSESVKSIQYYLIVSSSEYRHASGKLIL